MDSIQTNNGYYIVEHGQKKGPIEVAALEEMRRQGTLGEDSLLWTHGMAQWQPARVVLPQIFTASAAIVNRPPADVAVTHSEPAVPGAAVSSEQLVIADAGQRVLAGLIDGCVLAVMQGIIGSLIVPTLGAALIGELVPFLYMTVPMAGDWQATLGMKLLGLKCVDYSGQKLTFGATAIRYLVSIISFLILGIGYLMVFFTERRQTLHDIAAKMLVVRRN